MRTNIKNKAKELGFQDIGFAKYELLSEEVANYKKWLRDGYNAGMQWMERNISKRKNVRELSENANTVIVVSYNYFSGASYNLNKKSNGKISRYAWNYDYHDIIKSKLFKLADYISESYNNHIFRVYVDTGPVLEKIWAEKAGVGWQGKNSLILSKNYGSYFFLGIIISNIKLDSYDSPVKDYCMSCTKCMDACPTNAITEPKVVDSDKCISYWTIESKPDEKFPEIVTENLNNWVFGCDICQEVCPWNRHKPEITEDLRFHPRNDETSLRKEMIMNMEQSDFSERFRKSPIKRTKLSGLKRNFNYL